MNCSGQCSAAWIIIDGAFSVTCDHLDGPFRNFILELSTGAAKVNAFSIALQCLDKIFCLKHAVVGVVALDCDATTLQLLLKQAFMVNEAHNA